MIKSGYPVLLVVASTLLVRIHAFAQDSRLLRSPTIHEDKISFVYAGDIWVADRSGANVKRITAFEGVGADPHFQKNL